MSKRSRYLVALDDQIEAAEAEIKRAEADIAEATKRSEEALGVWRGLVRARERIEGIGPLRKREPITPFLPAPAPEVPTQPVSLGMADEDDFGAPGGETVAVPDLYVTVGPAPPPGADNREGGPDVPAFLQRQTNPAAIPGDGNTPHDAANSEGVQ